ncbi:hypothetical protein JCM1840_000687 [Sporobolomyces johnsonii]
MPNPRLPALVTRSTHSPTSWLTCPSPRSLAALELSPCSHPSLPPTRAASSRSSSSNQWIQRQRNDPFVRARASPTSSPSPTSASAFVSRSAFKLIDLHHQSPREAKLLRPGMTVVDLGAAPGGWIQAAQEVLRGEGTVVGVDLLPLQRGIDELHGVHFVRGNFLDPAVQAKVQAALSTATGQRRPTVDLVLSDMMANTTGNTLRDAELSLSLCEAALSFALQHLSPAPSPSPPAPSPPVAAAPQLIMKHFASSHTPEFRAKLRRHFRSVRWSKPESSRKESKEGFLVCSELRPVEEWPSVSTTADGGPGADEANESSLYF